MERRPSYSDRRPSLTESRVLKTTERDSNTIEKIIIFLSYFMVAVFFPFVMFFCFTTIHEYERAVVLRLGRYRKKGGLLGPGVCFLIPFLDDVMRIDLRTTSFDVPAQEILTKDSITITVDAIVYIRIADPLKAVLQVVDPEQASELLAQTTLRSVAGTKLLIEFLSSREQLSKEILHKMEEATDAWGVKVERVEISDISLPEELQRSMVAEQEAIREAKAKVVAADGELQSSYMLRDASETMAKNPIALQLRYLQTLGNIAAEDRNHTVILPLPLDIIRRLNNIFGGDDKSGDNRKKAGTEESLLNGITKNAKILHNEKNEGNTQTSTEILVESQDGPTQFSEQESDFQNFV